VSSSAGGGGGAFVFRRRLPSLAEEGKKEPSQSPKSVLSEEGFFPPGKPVMHLCSRRPRWASSVGCLVMDFDYLDGDVASSAKNFQLIRPSDPTPEEVRELVLWDVEDEKDREGGRERCQSKIEPPSRLRSKKGFLL
jgi:hypothetical protein